MRVVLMAMVFLLIDLGVGSLAVRGQSLGDVAAKEKERRSGQTTRVITDDDLAKVHRDAPAEEAPAATAAAPAAPAASPGSTPAKTESDLRAERRKAWSERREAAEKALAALTQRIEELQRITGDRRVYAYDATRAKLLQELKDSQEKLPAAQQKLDDLIEEGRREGF